MRADGKVSGGTQLDPTDRDNDPASELADELVARWRPLLVDKNWPERLQLLHQIHEQLQEDLEDIAFYSRVSPIFIRKTIDDLGDGPIISREQAHIYANSGDPEHRRAAGEWFATQPRKEQPSRL
jgi:hypothetical protein